MARQEAEAALNNQNIVAPNSRRFHGGGVARPGPGGKWPGAAVALARGQASGALIVVPQERLGVRPDVLGLSVQPGRRMCNSDAAVGRRLEAGPGPGQAVRWSERRRTSSG